MANQKVNAAVPNKDDASKPAQTCTIDYDFGDTVSAAVEKFGEDVVLSNMKAHMVVTCQGVVRRLIRAGATEQADIQVKVTEWKPGVAVARESKDPVEALAAKFDGMDEEGQKALLKRIKDKMAAKARG